MKYIGQFFLLAFLIDSFLPRFVPSQSFIFLLCSTASQIVYSRHRLVISHFGYIAFCATLLLGFFGLYKALTIPEGEVLINLMSLPLAFLIGHSKRTILSSRYLLVLKLCCLSILVVGIFGLLFLGENRSTLFGISSIAFGKYIILYVLFSYLRSNKYGLFVFLRAFVLGLLISHKAVLLISFIQYFIPILFRFVLILLVWLCSLYLFSYLSGQYPIFLSVSYRLTMLVTRLSDFFAGDAQLFLFGFDYFSSSHSSIIDVILHLGLFGFVLFIISFIYLLSFSRNINFFAILPLLLLSLFSAGVLGLRDVYVWGFLSVCFTSRKNLTK